MENGGKMEGCGSRFGEAGRGNIQVVLPERSHRVLRGNSAKLLTFISDYGQQSRWQAADLLRWQSTTPYPYAATTYQSNNLSASASYRFIRTALICAQPCYIYSFGFLPLLFSSLHLLTIPLTRKCPKRPSDKVVDKKAAIRV